MRDYLHSYPEFDLRRELAYRVQEQTGSPVELPDVPGEIVDLAAVFVSDLFEHADYLLAHLDELLNDLFVCMQKHSGGPLPAEQYRQALEESNYVAARQYEAYHRESLQGSTQAELYALLYDLRDNVRITRDYLLANFPGAQSEPGQSWDDLRAAEQERYLQLAQQELSSPGSVDRLPLAYEAQLKYQIQQRLAFAEEFSAACQEVARATVDDTCQGRVEEVVGHLVEAEEETLRGLKTVMEAGFVRLAERGAATAEQGRLYGNKEVLRRLQEAAVSLRQLRFGAVGQVLTWLKSLDTAGDTAPATTLVANALPGLDAIDRSLDTTILDLSKANKMDVHNKTEMLANVHARKQLRQLIRLTEDVLATADFDAADRRAQASLLVEALGLKRAGDICSP